mgnify:CR=1 FL=1
MNTDVPESDTITLGIFRRMVCGRVARRMRADGLTFIMLDKPLEKEVRRFTFLSQAAAEEAASHVKTLT